MFFIRKKFLGSQPRKTLRPKIDLNHKIRKVWVRKYDLTCLASFTCLRALLLIHGTLIVVALDI